MHKKRILSLLLAAVMLLPANVTAFAYDKTSKEPPNSTQRVEQLRNSGVDTVESEDPIDPAEEITAIVKLNTQPEVSVASDGSRKIKNQNLMLRQQKTVQNEISSKVLDGAPLEVLDSYTAVTNGFSVKVPYGKLDEIRALPDVAAAYAAPVFKVAPDMPTTMTELGGLENISGYQGEGMVIAIVDSGLEISHPVFRVAPTDPALTQQSVADILTAKDLKAEEKNPGITASQVYRGAKVPFAFDYADNDLDVTPGSAGDHGTHVAGIAAANAGVVADVVGVAPQAQILAMKVFSSSGSNGATWNDILAAADDAVALGADVINMSLGSTCGFSTPEGEKGVAEVFQRIADSGVMLSISAGNEYSAAYGSRIGKGHALTDNPDYGTVASPSSYSEPLSVASVEQQATIDSFYLTAGERKIAFNDTVEDQTVDGVGTDSPTFRSLAGREWEYVVVPNNGDAADYETLALSGKIALVSRGGITYQAKKEAAKKAGAAGILVYNNEPGMLYMQLDKYDLPSAFISQADGKYLAARASDVRKLTISNAKGTVDNPTTGEMSDFSSWGVTPELTLKPDITAPGGNIKSATVGGGYTTKSGTSMAAPFVSGAMAVVKQYIEQKGYASSKTDKAALVNALLMSTADLVMAGSDPYSPRKQGAGSVNIAAATSTKAYLTAADGSRPKVELGDDAQKSGSYTVKFQLHNLSGEELTYTLGGYVQTDGQEVTKQIGGKDVHQVTELPYRLEAKIPAQTVTVPANGTETVSVAVSLTEADKQYLSENFKNGTYVEGFVTLTPESDVQPVLSIPYMGFYGDWTKAPIVDATDYGAYLNDKSNSWSQAYVNTAASSSLEGTVNTYLGDNPYHSGVAYLSDRNAISPNGDDYMDSLSFAYTGLLRNVKALKYEIRDAATNEVYYDNTVDYETKSVYSTNYYQIVPSGASDYNKFSWNGTKKDGYAKVLNNTKVIATVTGELSYDKHPGNNEKSSWSFPITIDTEEPEAKNITVSNEDGKYYVSLKVTDNQFVSNVTISNASETKELASFPVAENTAGATTECRYDITGFGENLKLVVNDYACNRKVYSVKAEGNTDNSEVIVPTKSVFQEDFEESTFPPEGWTTKVTNAGKTWYQGTEHGSKMAMVDLSKTEQQDEWLITPAINLKEQETKAGMIFDFYTSYYWSVEQHAHNLKVKASTDNGATWGDIWELWGWNQKNAFGPWEKTQAKVTIPEKFQNAESVKFAFVYEGKNGTSLWLDNVNVYVEDPSQIHTITATAGKGGSIDPSGAVQISDGKSRTFTITPDEGHFIQDVQVDGKSVGTPTNYTFSTVTADHTIAVTFGGSADAEQLINEDFESGTMPTGWTLARTNQKSYSTWQVYKYSSHYGLYCSADEYDSDSYQTTGAGQDERITFPAQNLNGKTANFAFDFVANKTRLKSGKTVCTLEGSTDGGKTWMAIWNAADVADQMTTCSFNGYVHETTVSVSVPEAMQKDGVLFSFHYVLPKNSTMGSITFIDNLKLQASTSSQPGGGEESTLLDENFDDYQGKVPTDWTIKKSSSAGSYYNWRINKSYNQIGATCSADIDSVYDYWGAGQDEYLITPVLDLSGKSNAKMTFQFSGKQNGLSETVVAGKTTVTLEASMDGGTTWKPIWNAYSIKDELKSDVLASNIETADAAVSIPAEYQVANVQFAFRYQTANKNTGGCTLFVDNVKLTAVGGGETPTPPAETFTITASAGQGGSISPNGEVSVQKGAGQTFTITPSEGYEIEDVKVDGKSVGKVNTYSFENVTAEHTIAAAFSEKAVVLPDSIHEDFNEGSMPTGWTVEGPSAKDNYNTWKIDRYQTWRSDAAVCSANFMVNTEQNEKLILPQINMGSSMQLSFDFAANYKTLSSGALKLTVKASLDKGQTWTEIWNARKHMGAIDENNTPEDVTGKGSVAIPSNFCMAGAQFAFVFENTGKNGASAAIDNVVLAAGSTPAPNMYGITIGAMEHGTVTADKQTAAAGETVTLTVTPDSGYHLKAGSLLAGNTVVDGNTFIMPAKAVIVTALFVADDVTPSTGSYKDGVYTGSAQGRNGTVAVSVTVENGKIKSIDVTEQKETKDYWEKAKATIATLLGLGDDSAVAAVDTKTGATLSSEAIKTAVQNALKSAKQEDSGIFDGGSGTEQSPYLINSVDTLLAFAQSVNGGEDYSGKYVALGGNLDLSDVDWVPIGKSDHGKTTGFAGTFDGRGYTVSHVSCGSGSAPTKYEADGFFGVVSGTVRNLNVQIDKFYNDYDAANDYTYAGGLVGLLERNGIVDHCSVTGGSQAFSINSSTKAAIGGLVGQMRSESMVANSWSDIGLNYGTLSMDAANVAMGGICGKQAQNSLIANSASFGSVPGFIYTGTIRVGGLVGYTGGAIYNCYTDSTTKLNVFGVTAGTAVPSIGHLIGGAENGAALYQCYYDKNADQFGNTDFAGDPSEGKTERRQAVGRDSDSAAFPDTTFVTDKTANDLVSADFAKVMNDNLKNATQTAATAYFRSKNLLTGSVDSMEDKLSNGFRGWKLADGRVLFGDEVAANLEITDVALLPQQSVAYGTAKDALNLPKTVEVTLSDRTKRTLSVTWACDKYDGNTAGAYTFEGTLNLTAGIANPKAMKAYVVVTVEAGSEPVTEYQVTVNGGSGSGSYTVGTIVTIKANTPASGYAFNGWTATGVTLADASASTTTFEMPGHDVSITANWKNTGSSGGSTGGGGSSGGSSSGGGSSAVSGAKYDVEAPNTANGTVSVSPVNAAKGSKVTITVSPANGYALGNLMVTDANGNVLGLTKQSDGKYTFVMPASKVMVEASFVKSEQAAGVSGFADVSTNAYYANAVAWAVSEGITSGTAAAAFSPNASCTRGQMVTFLWRAAGSPEPKMAFNPFADVAADAYYYKAVLWAVESGITGGVSANTFAPNATVTRSQTVTFLYRAAGSPTVSGSGFSDVSGDAYYASAVAWAVQKGVTSGIGNGQFSPNADCTRAQIVTFLFRNSQVK